MGGELPQALLNKRQPGRHGARLTGLGCSHLLTLWLHPTMTGRAGPWRCFGARCFVFLLLGDLAGCLLDELSDSPGPEADAEGDSRQQRNGDQMDHWARSLTLRRAGSARRGGERAQGAGVTNSSVAVTT